MTRTLFGTDGIRGEAGVAPLDERTVRATAEALARVLEAELGRAARVVIGRDTRESGVSLSEWVASGLASQGASVRSAGVVPTPAVSLLVRGDDFDAGVMVSASHNPWRDNGLKVFSHRGTKLDDGLERRIEREVALRLSREGTPARGELATKDEPALRARHADHLVEAFSRGSGLRGLSIVVDCAHGSLSGIAPAVFERLGASVVAMADAPDGRNINHACGAVHPERLAREVVARGASAGVAFDGDADRCILVDSLGRIVDGDAVLLAAADDMRAGGMLRGGGVVGTVMSNFGLERALRERGGTLVRERVGDRNVLERMLRDGYNLGGEPSGHVIFLDRAPTGDGLQTALVTLSSLNAAGRSLADARDALPRTPQVLLNVRVRHRRELEDVEGHAERVRRWQDRLGSDGRVVVRWSGTEPLVRVMAEGADEALIGECARDIAAHIESRLGAA